MYCHYDIQHFVAYTSLQKKKKEREKKNCLDLHI